jgi:hypothetical protein
LTARDWAGSFEKAPRGDVVVGLRRVSASGADTALVQAAKSAVEVDDPDAAVQRFNNKAMAWAVAYGHCSPNDASQPCEDLGMRGDDEIEERLTPQAIRRLFDELEDLHNESPMYPPASDAELGDLVGLLTSPERPELDAPARRLAGRLLRALRVDESPG